MPGSQVPERNHVAVRNRRARWSQRLAFCAEGLQALCRVGSSQQTRSWAFTVTHVMERRNIDSSHTAEIASANVPSCKADNVVDSMHVDASTKV